MNWRKTPRNIPASGLPARRLDFLFRGKPGEGFLAAVRGEHAEGAAVEADLIGSPAALLCEPLRPAA